MASLSLPSSPPGTG